MSTLITSDGSHVVHRGEVVVAVVPVYNPSLRLHDVVTRLIRQCAYVVVVDDGSEEESWTFVSGMSSDQVRIIRRSHNSGIAAALNEGVRYSLTEWDVDFILTCDQDSLLSDLYVAAALHRLRQADGQEGYALVAPGAYNGRRVRTRIGRPSAPLEPMQSGMLIRAVVFECVGLFVEELFIDCVDADFYQRCLAADLEVLSAPPLPLEHQLGEVRAKETAGNRLPHHPPWRTYFVVRNRLTVLRKYARNDPEWALRIALLQVVILSMGILTSADRIAQLRAIQMGYSSFRRGELGDMSALSEGRFLQVQLWRDGKTPGART